MLKAVILWLIAFQAWAVPLPKQYKDETDASYSKRLGEPREEALKRREVIATAIATVALDESEKPLFSGPQGRLMTAVFLDSIASYEGMYHRLVHSGVWKGDCPPKVQADGTTRPCTIAESTAEGHSWCDAQLNIGNGKTTEGWTGKDLIATPDKCFRAALHVLHASVKECSAAPYNFSWTKDGPDLFGGYTSGKCFRGNEAARHRWNRAEMWFSLASPQLKEGP